MPGHTQKKRLDAGMNGAMMSPQATKDLQRPVMGAARAGAIATAAATPPLLPLVEATLPSTTELPCMRGGKCWGTRRIHCTGET